MDQHLNSRPNDGVRRLRPGRLAWLPVPVLLTAETVFWAAGLQGSHESLYVLLTLNLVFSLLVCLFVAYLVARSFLVRGTPGLLLLGCGVVIWGPAGVVATAAARGDANMSITIYNSCVWLSAVCHLAGVFLSLRSRRSLSGPALWLPGAYTLAAGAVMLVALSARAGWIPTFFIQDRGGTPVRQIVLFSAIVMFALTALLLGATRRQSTSAFTYWYALALALIAVGLSGVLLETDHASILGWTGRVTQALGGLYMLIAAVAAVRETRLWGISLEAALRESEERYRTLVETAPDAIVVHRDGRLLYTNSAALALVGANRFEQLTQHTVLDFFRPTEREQIAERTRRAMGGDRLPMREGTLLRLDDKEVTAEFHTAPVDFGGVRAVLTIIRDITGRKRAEDALRDADEDLRAQAEQLQTVNDMLQVQQRDLAATNEYLRVQDEELAQGTEALRESEQRLAAELDAMRRLHDLSTQLIHGGDIQELYEQMLDTAIAVMHADFASIQILQADGVLRLLAWRGFHPRSARSWDLVRLDSTTSCGAALRTGGRYVIADTEQCDLIAGTRDLKECRRSGIRSMQSTPLISRSGRLLGMLSTHWRRPYEPPADALHLFDVLARQVADLIERRQDKEALWELNATLEAKVAQRTAELQRRAGQLQRLTLELSQAEDRERRRIAALLHEDIQQYLAGARFHLNLLRQGPLDGLPRAIIDRVDGILKEAIDRSRGLCRDLSPVVLHMNDLSEVLRWLARQAQARHGLTIHMEVPGHAILAPETLAMFLFRVAQELLFNVVKHAGVSKATLRLRRTRGRLRLMVADRGQGFDTGAIAEIAGFGLLSIRERVGLLGGRMKVRSVKGRGSAVLVAIPDHATAGTEPPGSNRDEPARDLGARPAPPHKPDRPPHGVDGDRQSDCASVR